MVPVPTEAQFRSVVQHRNSSHGVQQGQRAFEFGGVLAKLAQKPSIVMVIQKDDQVLRMLVQIVAHQSVIQLPRAGIPTKLLVLHRAVHLVNGAPQGKVRHRIVMGKMPLVHLVRREVGL